MVDDLAELGVTDLVASIAQVPEDRRAYERTFEWLATRSLHRGLTSGKSGTMLAHHG